MGNHAALTVGADPCVCPQNQERLRQREFFQDEALPRFFPLPFREGWGGLFPLYFPKLKLSLAAAIFRISGNANSYSSLAALFTLELLVVEV